MFVFVVVYGVFFLGGGCSVIGFMECVDVIVGLC